MFYQLYHVKVFFVRHTMNNRHRGPWDVAEKSRATYKKCRMPRENRFILFTFLTLQRWRSYIALSTTIVGNYGKLWKAAILFAKIGKSVAATYRREFHVQKMDFRISNGRCEIDDRDLAGKIVLYADNGSSDINRVPQTLRKSS